MRGIGLAIAGAVLFGAVTSLSRLLLGNAGPATAGALTFLGAGLVGFLVMTLSRAPRSPALDMRSRLVFCAASVLGAVAAPMLLMTGLQHTPAALASILTNIEGIATVGLAWLLFKERPDALGIAGVITILCGVACFTLTDGVGMTANDGWLLVGAAYLCWAVDVNLMKCVPGIPPDRATAVRGIGGALVMAGIAWLRQEQAPDAITIASGLLIGALGFGISFMLMLQALPLIGAARVGAMFACAPVFGYIFSAFIERGALDASMLRWFSLALIATGILVSGFNAFKRESSGATNYSAGGVPG